ncbi:hypothetical protein BA059_27455 [Mycolicibacterium sp. (ex Dasyatis americana)]|nr:hypothetical protein BA059_27455 [Mycolicibacterium sp. (ex Dasyatis americana)]
MLGPDVNTIHGQEFLIPREVEPLPKFASLFGDLQKVRGHLFGRAFRLCVSGDRTLYGGRMTAHTAIRQHSVMIGFALGRNAIASFIHQRHQQPAAA